MTAEYCTDRPSMDKYLEALRGMEEAGITSVSPADEPASPELSNEQTLARYGMFTDNELLARLRASGPAAPAIAIGAVMHVFRARYHTGLVCYAQRWPSSPITPATGELAGLAFHYLGQAIEHKRINRFYSPKTGDPTAMSALREVVRTLVTGHRTGNDATSERSMAHHVDAVIASHDWEQLSWAIPWLNKRQRSTITELSLHRRGIGEVAAELGITANALRSRRDSAIERIRQLVAE